MNKGVNKINMTLFIVCSRTHEYVKFNLYLNLYCNAIHRMRFIMTTNKNTNVNVNANIRIVPVSQLLMPVDNMLRLFERGKQEKDAQGNFLDGKGDKAYLTYWERRLSMEKELNISGYANHTPIIVYEGRKGAVVNIEEGPVDSAGKYIVADGTQRTGTAYEMGVNTPVQIQVVSEARAREMMVSANFHRKANSPAQFTKILKADIAANPDLTISALCTKYSMSESTIKRFLDVLTLPAEISENVGTENGLSIALCVTLADKIKRLGKGDKSTINTLITAAKESKEKLESVSGDISAKQNAAKLAIKKMKPVYVPLQPIYNAERYRIVLSQIENELCDDPENVVLLSQLEVLQYIHGVSESDIVEDKAKFEKLYGFDTKVSD